MSYKKKLIEVALPLEAINAESAREKSIRHGHPSTLHLWWARRPLATCRAVLFAQMVDDPSAYPDQFPTEEAQQQERERLFRIIEELVKWENINNEAVLEAARAEIRRCAPPEGLPPVLDPFAGGGSIPLEAQRLGLEAHASDLNPVAVLINKAMIEIPPKFAGQPPVNPATVRKFGSQSMWKGAAGLAEDVRHYGQWMRDEAQRRIGHLYPKVSLPNEGEATVVAWLWARTVTCPNPACRAKAPLSSSFWLSKKQGKEVWLKPIIDRTPRPPTIHFNILSHAGIDIPSHQVGGGTGVLKADGKRVKAMFRCVCCDTPISGEYVDQEANAGRMGKMPLAIVAESSKGRIYVPFSEQQKNIAINDARAYIYNNNLEKKFPDEPSRGTFAGNAQGRIYGFRTFGDYFTDRQLVALTTFSDLVKEVQTRVIADAQAARLPTKRAAAYADAIATYLGMAVSRLSDICNALCRWENTRTQVRNLFTRQAVPMLWDFAEPDIFAGGAGDFGVTLGSMLAVLGKLPAFNEGIAQQQDASSNGYQMSAVISTDPPYYDNIGYADLSDFFYVWLKRTLSEIYPQLFSTLLVPKAEELIASRYRFNGSREQASEFFEQGLLKTFGHLRRIGANDYPVTVYYAFKQSESDDNDDEEIGKVAVASTGWETMLEGLIRSGFQVTATWPTRTELANRMLAKGTNALASSIVLVCRPRTEGIGMMTRRDFLNTLKRELPAALRHLQQGNIAPVDLAQASIGPGMAIYSRYSKVVEADGSAMSVRTALALINQALDEYLTEQESDYDADTRWALAWYEQHGFDEGVYGDAETLSRAKGTSVQGMVDAGFLYARAGKARLLRREELDPDWNPAQDTRLTVWEMTQQLIRALDEQGVEGAARLLSTIGPIGDMARELTYRLYALGERKGWTQEALAYNGLVVSWTDIGKRAAEIAAASPVQGRLGLS